MNEVANSRRALNFLRDEMDQVDHKIAHLENALDACDDCLETDGVKAALKNAGTERALLHDLIMSESSAEALSLDALVLNEIDSHRQAAQRLAGHWQRGHRTPAAYWNNELQLTFLNELLTRYHAWASSRPQHDHGDTDLRAYPWYMPGAADHARQLDTLYDRLYAALWQARYPYDHLDIIAQGDGAIIATGYAHSDAERERVLDLISSVGGAQDIVFDIRVVHPDHCPACQPGHHVTARPPA